VEVLLAKKEEKFTYVCISIVEKAQESLMILRGLDRLWWEVSLKHHEWRCGEVEWEFMREKIVDQ